MASCCDSEEKPDQVVKRQGKAKAGFEVSDQTPVDAIVIGSGPNGLAAAIYLAQKGLSVLVNEAQATIGGGARSAELTLPGFIHDTCSAIHPLAATSPFFVSLPLSEHSLEWIYPPLAVAHPLDDGTAVVLEQSIAATSEGLGIDAARYRTVMTPLVRDWPRISGDILGPMGFPQHPIATARFGLRALRSAAGLARDWFKGPRARALFAGIGAHSMLPLERSPSAAIALVLAIAGHVKGWPMPCGGAQRITGALASYLSTLGGRIRSGMRVDNIDDLGPRRLTMCDLTPRQLISIAGHRLPSGYRRSLERYRYGVGVFKVDWALDGPIPWKAPDCARTATVHLGGTLEEVAAAELAPWEGRTAERPFVLLTQPSLFDPTRAPAGKHTAWGYCHVPNGSTLDMTDRIESQVERFAPGFRDLILARHVMTPAWVEQHNANLVGGDINGGVLDLSQTVFRPTRRLYSTPVKGLYICSSATPPGGGVHGMCGYHAARRALNDLS